MYTVDIGKWASVREHLTLTSAAQQLNNIMNTQGTYPQGEREDFREWKERDLYYEAQASNKPRERKDNETHRSRGTIPHSKEQGQRETDSQ